MQQNVDQIVHNFVFLYLSVVVLSYLVVYKGLIKNLKLKNKQIKLSYEKRI